MAARKLINVAVQVLRVDVVKRTTYPHLSVAQKVLTVRVGLIPDILADLSDRPSCEWGTPSRTTLIGVASLAARSRIKPCKVMVSVDSTTATLTCPVARSLAP